MTGSNHIEAFSDQNACFLGFQSNRPLSPRKFYCYELEFRNVVDREIEPVRLFKSFCRRLNSWKPFFYFAVHDETKIYTLQKVEDSHCQHVFKYNSKETPLSIIYIGEYDIPTSNQKVYESIIPMLIKRNVINTQDKNNINDLFQLKDGEIVTHYILNRDSRLFEDISGNNSRYRIYRKHKIQCEIRNDDYFQIFFIQSSPIESKPTLLELYLNGHDIDGMRARFLYDDVTGHSKTGKITLHPKNPPKEYATIEELKKYYCDKYPYYFMTWNWNKDDFVVFIENKTRGGKINYTPYPASMLAAVQDFHTLNSIDNASTKDVQPKLLLDMNQRQFESRLVAGYIGNIQELGDIHLSSIDDSINKPKLLRASDAGFHATTLPVPELNIGKGNKIKGQREWKKAIFSYGEPLFLPKVMRDNEKTRILCISMTTSMIPEENLISVVKRMLDVGYKKLDAYSNFEYFYAYYDKDKEISKFDFAKRMKDEFSPHIVLGCVDNDKCLVGIDDTDEEILYEEMKEAFGDNEIKIPTQFFELKTYNIFRGVNKNAEYYARNICLGVLGKLGGTPYCLAENPENIDLYIGIDVGKERKGIHIPCAASTFTGDGKFIGVISPRDAIEGESIPVKSINGLLDRIVSFYKTIQHKTPESVVIHRDGKFRGDEEKHIQEYFSRIGAKVQLVEVTKSGNPRFFNPRSQKPYNPIPGSVLMSSEQNCSYLITSTPIRGGAPNPIRVTLKGGDLGLSLEQVTRQVYNLTKIDASSFNDTRLPITIRYADKISKNPNYIPRGEVVINKYFI